jgi:predicted ATPase/serine/threonine protein kinase/GAF domain-containing protein
MFQPFGYEPVENLSLSPRTLVVRARRSADDRPVVLKTTVEECPEPSVFAGFQREFEILRLLDGRGAVRVLDFQRMEFRPVLALEDTGGRSLKLAFGEKPPDLRRSLETGILVLERLAEIHRLNVIHKDVNPSNIIVNADGGVRLIDFGIATRISREQPVYVNPGGIAGTLRYISPEQTGRLNRCVDRRTDLYSFGVMLYEWLAGRPPFEFDDPFDLVYGHLALVPPDAREFNSGIPDMVSAILARLLAKNPDERYQSADGIRADLQESIRRLASRDASVFAIGKLDGVSRLRAPNRLYGRKREMTALEEAFERVGRGAREIVTVAGYSGIGKTSLVGELFPSVTRRRGFFASGKFEQLQRNIPYAALTQAFRGLIRDLLTESESHLAGWRSVIEAALGENVGVITPLIPELKLITGDPGPVADLLPHEAGRRLRHLFSRFVACFAAFEHPLVIFLDDLQWADAASLSLISDLMGDEQAGHVLFVFAYRDNEVATDHSFRLLLDGVRWREMPVTELKLAPLDGEAVAEYVGDVLGGDQPALAELLLAKTGGNPFFVGELLNRFFAEGFIRPDESGTWRIDMEGIRHSNPSENVVDLLTEILSRLPASTLATLTVAACLGRRFSVSVVAGILEIAESEVIERLSEAVAGDFVLGRTGEADFAFVHDRVQQATYALIPETERPAIHHRIGRFLAADETFTFEAVDHLNLGRSVLSTPREFEELAGLNLKAGVAARRAAAFEQAMNYFRRGIQLLSGVSSNPWKSHYAFSLNLHVEAVEAAFASGDEAAMDAFSETVLARAKTVLDSARVRETRLRHEFMKYRFQEAVATGLEALRELGQPLNAKPTPEEFKQAFAETQAAIGGRLHAGDVLNLADLPEMTDPQALAISRIFHRLALAAYLGAPQMMDVLNLTHIRLLLEKGNDALASSAYAGFGLLLISRFGEVDRSNRFGDLALRLAERPEARATLPRTILVVNRFLRVWKVPLAETLDQLLEGFQRGKETGEFEFAAVCLTDYIKTRLAIGIPLGLFNAEIELHEAALTALRHERQLAACRCLRQFGANLAGPSETPFRLDGIFADGPRIEAEARRFGDHGTLSVIGFLRLYLGVLFNRPEMIREGAGLVRENFRTMYSTSLEPRFLALESIGLLSIPAPEETIPEGVQVRVGENQTRLERWATDAPMNFAQLYWLVEAERARVVGNVGDAIDAFDRAIALSRENGFLNDEALANERAATFFLELGKPKLALPYARDARHGYVRWGAMAKAADIEARFGVRPNVVESPDSTETGSLKNTGTTGSDASVALDYAAVMRAAQSLSGEIVTENLLSAVLKTAVELAGAQRGALTLPDQRGEWRVEAQRDVLTGGDRTLHSEPISETAFLSRAIVNFVVRTGEAVLLEDAAQSRRFAADAYLETARPRAVWCFPVQRQGRTVAVLYLEHRTLTNVFTAARREALDIIAAQAAVSLENARLYGDLEVKVRERTDALSQANAELAKTVDQLEAARAETERKNAELDRKISELNLKHQELVVAHQQADRIFSALALALPGTVLDGKYRLEEKIGEGGFGIVFRATHLTLGRAIAVKVFKPRPGNDNAQAIERFKREGVSVARLSHPNIISVLDSGISAQGIAYLVMELLRGVSLAEEFRGGGLTTVRKSLERILPVCDALAEAHRHDVIHRDVKPDNVFLNLTPLGETVKVVDFGIAKMVSDDTGEELEQLTATNSLIGTPIYMSPERLSAKSYDGRSDVYSVGVMLYEMFAGRPPFEKSLSGLVGLMLSHMNDTPPRLVELNPLVPPELEALIDRTLEKSPDNRPSAAELAAMLRELLEGLPPAVADMPFDRRAPLEAFIPTVFSSEPDLVGLTRTPPENT